MAKRPAVEAEDAAAAQGEIGATHRAEARHDHLIANSAARDQAGPGRSEELNQAQGSSDLEGPTDVYSLGGAGACLAGASGSPRPRKDLFETMKDNLYYLGVNELHESLRTGEVSPIHVVEQCLERIAALNPRLNAFALVMDDQARAQAQQAHDEIQGGRWRGPLHGVPVGIKDFYDTAGIATTAAFDRFKHRVPRVDAASVARLKEAGAVIVGKMNMHTLGTGTTGLESCFGPVQNPWNHDFIPGGSSSGSAAAVAAGLCYATLDTDAIGSCRLPAACCGVVGFKGTYGLISMKGILEGEKADEAILWYSHAGITTRSVGDTSSLLRALAEPPRRGGLERSERHASERKRLRVGVADNAKADPRVERLFAVAVDTLRRLGHDIIATTAPLDIPAFGDLHAIESDRQDIADRAFREVDILVLPTLTGAVLGVDQARGNPQALSPAFTVFANYFGLPAISLPSGLDDNGLPTGLQFVGKPGDDGMILGLAHQYEAAGRSVPAPRPIP
jgi:aspartyl-tRNA(Asn)/glutamyl-tRNA(Gln) amidotransferase subunit A